MENKFDNIEEKVLDALAELGLVTEKLDGDVYRFTTGVATMDYCPSEDKTFLTITVPYLLSLENFSQTMINNVMEAVNCNTKYVKAYMQNGHCFLFYERMLFEWDIDHLEDILHHMVDNLNYTRVYIYDLVQKFTENEDEEDSGNDLEAPKDEEQD